MKRGIFLIIGLFLLYLIAISCFDIIRNNSLKKNFVVSNATVVRTSSGFKSGGTLVLEFKYLFKGSTYNTSQTISGVSFVGFFSNPNKLLSYPLLIDTTNPSNSHLMVSPNDFQSIKLEYPDSLKWVRGIYQKDFYSFW